MIRGELVTVAIDGSVQHTNEYCVETVVFRFRMTVTEDAVPADMMAEVKDKRQELIGRFHALFQSTLIFFSLKWLVKKPSNFFLAESIVNADDIIGDMFLEEKIPSDEDVLVRTWFVLRK